MIRKLMRTHLLLFLLFNFFVYSAQGQDLMDEVDALESDLPDDDIYGVGGDDDFDAELELDSLSDDDELSLSSGLDELPVDDDFDIEAGPGNTAMNNLPAGGEDSFGLESLPIEGGGSSNPSASDALTGVDVGTGQAKITDMEFRQLEDRVRLILKSDQPLDYKREVRTERQQVVLELSNSAIANPNLGRALDTAEFDGPVAIVQAFSSRAGIMPSTKVLFQLRKFVDPTVTRRGNSLYVDFPIADFSNSSYGKKQATGTQLETFLSLEGSRFVGKKINFKAKEAPVADVLNFLSSVSGKNFVLSNGGDKKVSLNIKNTPWDQVLAIVLLNAEMGYQKVGSTYRVMPLAKLRSEIKAAAEAADQEQKLLPKVTQLFSLSYAKASDSSEAVQKFISQGNGETVVTDERTNSLVVSATPKNIARIQKYLKNIDRQTPQIQIEARIVEAVKSFTRNFGVNWKFGLGLNIADGFVNVGNVTSTQSLINGGGSGLTDDIELLTASGNSLGPFTSGTQGDFGFVNALLSLGEKDSTTKIVASPSVIVADNKTANLVQGTQFTFLVPANGNNEETNVQTVDANLSLQVTPQVTNDQNVMMDIVLRRDSVAEALTAGSADSVPVNKREVNTELLVASGKTAVIGGLYLKDKGRTKEGWPLLKNIPLLGLLFTSQNSRVEQELELLMFISPKILNADQAFGFSDSTQI